MMKLDDSLSDDDRDLYRRIAGDDPAPAGAVAGQLVRLGLIDHAATGGWVARDPRIVGRGLMGDALEALQAAAQRIADVARIPDLAEYYDAARMYGHPGSEFLTDGAVMNARIGDVSATATRSVHTAQPGEPADRDPDIVATGIGRTLESLARGTRVRCLYAASAATHPQTREMVESIMGAGAEVRVARAFPRMLIVDTRHLFIEDHITDGAERNSGWHVTDPAVCAWATAVYDHLWEQATPWADLESHSAGGRTTARQRLILSELEAGYAQAQIARRMGVATRTLTKELAELRERLGFNTLYQVMAWWATAPDRHLI